MGLKKTTFAETIERQTFNSLEETIAAYENAETFETKQEALEAYTKFDTGAQKLVALLQIEEDHKIIDAISIILSNIDGDDAPIDEILTLLRRENAYVRNQAISILQDYGEAIRYYIVKYLIGDDRDLRIFAINVLGDVKFAESRDMMVELLESENDVNVAMTAVDYLGEIGQEEDVLLLESLKERFRDEFYVTFAVDNAISAIKG